MSERIMAKFPKWVRDDPKVLYSAMMNVMCKTKPEQNIDNIVIKPRCLSIRSTQSIAEACPWAKHVFLGTSYL